MLTLPKLPLHGRIVDIIQGSLSFKDLCQKLFQKCQQNRALVFQVPEQAKIYEKFVALSLFSQQEVSQKQLSIHGVTPLIISQWMQVLSHFENSKERDALLEHEASMITHIKEKLGLAEISTMLSTLPSLTDSSNTKLILKSLHSHLIKNRIGSNDCVFTLQQISDALLGFKGIVDADDDVNAILRECLWHIKIHTQKQSWLSATQLSRIFFGLRHISGSESACNILAELVPHIHNAKQFDGRDFSLKMQGLQNMVNNDLFTTILSEVTLHINQRVINKKWLVPEYLSPILCSLQNRPASDDTVDSFLKAVLGHIKGNSVEKKSFTLANMHEILYGLRNFPNSAIACEMISELSTNLSLPVHNRNNIYLKRWLASAIHSLSSYIDKTAPLPAQDTGRIFVKAALALLNPIVKINLKLENLSDVETRTKTIIELGAFLNSDFGEVDLRGYAFSSALAENLSEYLEHLLSPPEKSEKPWVVIFDENYTPYQKKQIQGIFSKKIASITFTTLESTSLRPKLSYVGERKDKEPVIKTVYRSEPLVPMAQKIAPITFTTLESTPLRPKLSYIGERKDKEPVTKAVYRSEPLVPGATRGGGDCAFHAACGEWDENAQEFVYHDIQTIRKRVANTVRISIAGQLIFPSIVAAIDELIRSTTRAIDFTGFPIIQALRTQFHTTQSVDLDWTNRSIIEEYASIIEKPGIWLLPAELSIIAHACQITIRYFIGNRTNPLQIQEYNPGHPIANVYFNGSNHYEAMRETGPFHPHLSNRMDVDPQPTLSLPQVGAYAASGLKHTLHGNVYQLKLLMLFLYRGLIKGYLFQLATEMDKAKKFDDSAFIFQKPGDQRLSYFFLQAKHKQDDHKVITDKDLLDTTDQDFSLAKYFASYQDIKKEPDFQNGTSSKFYLCTNIGLDLDPANDGERILKLSETFEPILTPDEMLDTSEHKAKKYRFKQGGFPGKALLCGTLRGNQQLVLASTLFAIMQKPNGKIKKTHKPFNDKAQYQWLLANKIIDDKTRRLSDDFIKGQNLTPHAAQFKTLYTQVESTQGATWVDKEVDEFLDHLVFAVNQPNEVRLGEIITKELGDEFNLIDGNNFIYAELQKAALDWMKQKQGTFLTQVSAEAFVESMRQKLSRLALNSPTLDYQAKLERYGIAFEHVSDIKKFLDPSNPNHILIYSTPGDVFLSNMQIYQTLLSLPDYTANDSYIFVTLKKTLRLKKLLINVFAKSKLLVIACNSGLSQEAIALILELSQLIKPQQKIIFITRDSQELRDPITTSKLSLIVAANNFASLTLPSQQKLRNWPIVFQGVLTTAGELIDDLNNIIDAEALFELLSGREIYVGKALENFEAKDYYIEQTLIGTQIAEEGLRRNDQDIMVISGITEDELNEIIHSNSSFKTTDSFESPAQFIILPPKTSLSKQDLVKYQREPGDCVHFLTRENGVFLWQQSLGNFRYLRKYTKPIKTNSPPNNQLVIISAELGMGKSTYLSHLAYTLKLNMPGLWIEKINLLDKEEQLKKAVFNKIEDVIHFLLQGESYFARKVFETYLKQDNKITLFLDGFDEIQAPQQAKVIQLLSLLTATNVKNIIVTTRAHTRESLEDALTTFAHDLERFDEEGVLRFLIKNWQASLGLLSTIDTEKAQAYGKRLIKLFYASSAFIGSSLEQAKLLAIAFLEDFKTFCREENSEPDLPKSLSLFVLYERFIKTRYNIFLQEKYGVYTQTRLDDIAQPFIEKLNKLHQLLAFKLLFPHYEITNDKALSTADRKLIQEIGIIQFFDGSPHFIHQTFAEYFAAQWLTRGLEKPTQNPKYQHSRDFLIRNIFKRRNQVIRTFIAEFVDTATNIALKQLWDEICNSKLVFNKKNYFHFNRNETLPPVSFPPILELINDIEKDATEAGDKVWRSLWEEQDENYPDPKWLADTGANLVKTFKVLEPHMAATFNSLLDHDRQGELAYSRHLYGTETTSFDDTRSDSGESDITELYPDSMNDRDLSTYAKNIWENLLKPILATDITNTPFIDKFALVGMCNHFISFFAKENPLGFKFEMTMTETQHLFQLIEGILNHFETNKNILSACINLLYHLLGKSTDQIMRRANKEGLQLIDTGNTLLFQDSSTDFEYELKLNHRYQAVKGLLLFKTKNPEDNLIFEQACARILATDTPTPRLKRTNSAPKILMRLPRELSVPGHPYPKTEIVETRAKKFKINEIEEESELPARQKLAKRQLDHLDSDAEMTEPPKKKIVTQLIDEALSP